MRTLVIFFSIIVPSATAFSQNTDTYYSGSALVVSGVAIRDSSGRIVLLNDHVNRQGSPLFNKTWGPGYIKLSEGKVYYDSCMNYSMYSDKLFVARNDSIYPVTYQVHEFSFKYIYDPGLDGIYPFRNGFPRIRHNTASSFYEVLSDGKHLKLLKHFRSEIKDIYHYGAGIEQAYATTAIYYVYFCDRDKMLELGNHINVRLLDRKLHRYAKSIDAFLKANKLDLKKDMNAAALFTCLDDPIRN